MDHYIICSQLSLKCIVVGINDDYHDAKFALLLILYKNCNISNKQIMTFRLKLANFSNPCYHWTLNGHMAKYPDRSNQYSSHCFQAKHYPITLYCNSAVLWAIPLVDFLYIYISSEQRRKPCWFVCHRRSSLIPADSTESRSHTVCIQEAGEWAGQEGRNVQKMSTAAVSVMVCKDVYRRAGLVWFCISHLFYHFIYCIESTVISGKLIKKFCNCHYLY